MEQKFYCIVDNTIDASVGIEGLTGLTLEQAARIMSGMQNNSSKDSQLNPRFVAEMMGFPPNWTELPFQSGEQKA